MAKIHCIEIALRCIFPDWDELRRRRRWRDKYLVQRIAKQARNFLSAKFRNGLHKRRTGEDFPQWREPPHTVIWMKLRMTKRREIVNDRQERNTGVHERPEIKCVEQIERLLLHRRRETLLSQ